MADRGVVRVDFYFDDFLSGAAMLTPEERGVYITICALIWSTENRLTDDDQKVARACNISTRAYRRIRRSLIEARKITVEDGFIRQKRAVHELTAATDRIETRAEIGRQGGIAKAEAQKQRATEKEREKAEKSPEKSPEISSSSDGFVNENNVTFLPIQQVPSLPLQDVSHPSEATSKKPKRVSFPADFEVCWKAYPHHASRSSKPDTFKEWEKLTAEERSWLLGAITRFIPNVAEAHGGKGAPAMERWLRRGLYLNYRPVCGVAKPAQKFAGPPELRAMIVSATSEEFAVNYIDPAIYEPESRALKARNRFAADKIAKDCRAVLERARVTVEIQDVKNRSAA